MTWQDVPEVSDVGMLLAGWKPTHRNLDEYRRLTGWRSSNPRQFTKLEYDIPCADHGARIIKAVDINRAIAHLDHRSQMLLTVRYWHGLTLKESGRVFGFNESRSCQIERAALAELRRMF